MDWDHAIEKHRHALKRILAMLLAMAGLSDGSAPKTLPRRLHRAVLRLLRPAESATRRLIVIAARNLEAITPPRLRRRNPKPASSQALKMGTSSAFMTQPGGTGILLPPGTPPPGALSRPPRPPVRALALPLFDPLRRWRGARRPVAATAPRIGVPGFMRRFPVAARPAPAPDDPLDAGRLGLRLAALAAALDDLPRQARRFARWQASSSFRAQEKSRAGRACRSSPLRPGRPPGGRPSGSKRAHPVHETLNDLHGLAFWALEQSRQKRAARPEWRETELRENRETERPDTS